MSAKREQTIQWKPGIGGRELTIDEVREAIRLNWQTSPPSRGEISETIQKMYPGHPPLEGPKEAP